MRNLAGRTGERRGCRIEEIRWDPLEQPPCHGSNLVCALAVLGAWAGLWSHPDWLPRTQKPAGRGGPGGCLRLLPLDVVAVPRETARCYTGEVTLYEGVVVAVLQEEPTRFARTQTWGPRGVTHKWTLLRGTEAHRDFRGWQIASYTMDWAGTMAWDDPFWEAWSCLCSCTWLSFARHWCSPMFPYTGATGIVPLETPSQQFDELHRLAFPALPYPHAEAVAQGEACWGISMGESAVPARGQAVCLRCAGGEPPAALDATPKNLPPHSPPLRDWPKEPES